MIVSKALPPLKSLLHFPVFNAVRLQLASASEIVERARYQLVSLTAPCVKMHGIRLAVGIDCDKHPLVLKFSLNDTLLIREHGNGNVAVAQRLAVFAYFWKKMSDEFGPV